MEDDDIKVSFIKHLFENIFWLSSQKLLHIEEVKVITVQCLKSAHLGRKSIADIEFWRLSALQTLTVCIPLGTDNTDSTDCSA